MKEKPRALAGLNRSDPMPWNPIKFYPNIIRDLKSRGFEKEFSIHALEDSIVRVLGITSKQRIARHVELLHRLGYIREGMGRDIWEFGEERSG